MENGIAIDTLHAQLLDLSRHDEYGFEELRCQDWGKANSEKYNKLKSNFIRSMRRLAKKAPVKYYGGSYYMFNGKIYEAVLPIFQSSCKVNLLRLQKVYLCIFMHLPIFNIWQH